MRSSRSSVVRSQKGPLEASPIPVSSRSLTELQGTTNHIVYEGGGVRMKALVLGGTGGMGQGVARDLIKQEQIKKVILG